MISTGTFSLKPTEAGTELTYVIEYEFHSLISRIMDKLVFARSVKKDSEKGLENLKSILEK
jgi:hypothetical protein